MARQASRGIRSRRDAAPARSVHTLADPPLTRLIFLTWTLGVPFLAFGLAATNPTGSILLLGGVLLNAVQMYHVATGANLLQP